MISEFPKVYFRDERLAELSAGFSESNLLLVLVKVGTLKDILVMVTHAQLKGMHPRITSINDDQIARPLCHGRGCTKEESSCPYIPTFPKNEIRSHHFCTKSYTTDHVPSPDIILAPGCAFQHCHSDTCMTIIKK